MLYRSLDTPVLSVGGRSVKGLESRYLLQGICSSILDGCLGARFYIVVIFYRGVAGVFISSYDHDSGRVGGREQGWSFFSSPHMAKAAPELGSTSLARFVFRVVVSGFTSHFFFHRCSSAVQQ